MTQQQKPDETYCYFALGGQGVVTPYILYGTDVPLE